MGNVAALIDLVQFASMTLEAALKACLCAPGVRAGANWMRTGAVDEDGEPLEYLHAARLTARLAGMEKHRGRQWTDADSRTMAHLAAQTVKCSDLKHRPGLPCWLRVVELVDPWTGQVVQIGRSPTARLRDRKCTLVWTFLAFLWHVFRTGKFGLADSQAAIAEMVGCSDRQLRRVIKTMLERGLLRVTRLFQPDERGRFVDAGYCYQIGPVLERWAAMAWDGPNPPPYKRGSGVRALCRARGIELSKEARKSWTAGYLAKLVQRRAHRDATEARREAGTLNAPTHEMGRHPTSWEIREAAEAKRLANLEVVFVPETGAGLEALREPATPGADPSLLDDLLEALPADGEVGNDPSPSGKGRAWGRVVSSKVEARSDDGDVDGDADSIDSSAEPTEPLDRLDMAAAFGEAVSRLEAVGSRAPQAEAEVEVEASSADPAEATGRAADDAGLRAPSCGAGHQPSCSTCACPPKEERAGRPDGEADAGADGGDASRPRDEAGCGSRSCGQPREVGVGGLEGGDPQRAAPNSQSPEFEDGGDLSKIAAGQIVRPLPAQRGGLRPPRRAERNSNGGPPRKPRPKVSAKPSPLCVSPPSNPPTPTPRSGTASDSLGHLRVRLERVRLERVRLERATIGLNPTPSRDPTLASRLADALGLRDITELGAAMLDRARAFGSARPDGHVACPDCGGTGTDKLDAGKVCSSCGGVRWRSPST